MACEGTRFTEKKRADSMKYAREKNLPELKYHLLPRTKGLTLILQGAKGQSELTRISSNFGYSLSLSAVPAVYNFMLAFTKDSAAPEFRTLLRGQTCKAQLYVKYANQANTFIVTLTIPPFRRIPISQVPYQDEATCAQWTQDLFVEKVKSIPTLETHLDPFVRRIACIITSFSMIPSPVSVCRKFLSVGTTPMR